MVSIKANRTVIFCSELHITIDSNECVYEDSIVDYKEIKDLQKKCLITIKTVGDDCDLPSAVMSKEDRINGIVFRKGEVEKERGEKRRDKEKWDRYKSECSKFLIKSSNKIEVTEEIISALQDLFEMSYGSDDFWMDLIEENPAAVFLAMIANEDLSGTTATSPLEYINSFK